MELLVIYAATLLVCSVRSVRSARASCSVLFFVFGPVPDRYRSRSRSGTGTGGGGGRWYGRWSSYFTEYCDRVVRVVVRGW